VKYCFYKMGLDSPSVDTWFRGMYDSMFESLRRAGHEVLLTMDAPDDSCDVLVAPLGGGQDQSTARAMAASSGPVVVYVPSARSWFRTDYLRRWNGRVVLAYGTDASDYSRRRYGELGIPYLHLPFGSDPRVMHPLQLEPQFDVVFVANANSGIGRQRFIDALMKRIEPDRMQLVGPGWERYGVPAQSVAWGPLLNALYGLGRVCVNLHNDEQSLGGTVQVDANNRLFDLAMAGRPQVCNAPAVVEHYFSQEEVPSYADPDAWAEAVVSLVSNAAAASAVAGAAQARALREHTWDARTMILDAAVEEAVRGRRSSVEAGACAGAMRLRDTLLPPYSAAELAGRVSRRARRVLGGGKVS
jgi:hypothetical protein